MFSVYKCSSLTNFFRVKILKLANIYLANSDFSRTGSPVIIIDNNKVENSGTEKTVKLQEIEVKNERRRGR